MARRWAALALAAWAGVGACSRGRDGQAPAAMEGLSYPEWVTRGSGAFGGEAGRAFYGVGLVSGIKNQALARTTADNRARAELARVFETYSASLMKDYLSSTTAGPQTAAAEEQHVEQAVKTFSAATLSGVQVVDHWFHPRDGSIYALARLDLQAFTDNLAKMHDLSDQVREFVRHNAERLHGELEREEAKRGAAAALTPGTPLGGGAP